MQNNRRIILLLLILAMLVFVSCSGEASVPGETASGNNPTASEEGFFRIDTKDITTNMKCFDYQIAGTTVQVLALRDATGMVHAAFNTCQSCSPSPKAYYLQSGDKLVCQNCKFEFTADEVGVVHGGCNPWPVDGIEITETEIRIPEASVEAMVSVFQNWAGPKG